jgi:hypothetical protein
LNRSASDVGFHLPTAGRNGFFSGHLPTAGTADCSQTMEIDMSEKIDDSLLTPDNHALLMIDHQYLQLLALRSHPNDVVVDNSVFLAKAAKVFNVPTLYTTAESSA